MGEEKKSRMKAFLAVGVLIVLFLMVFIFVRRNQPVRENRSEELSAVDVKQPAETENLFSDYLHQEIVRAGEKKISNELYEIELGEDFFYVDGIGITYKELPEVIRFYPITLQNWEQEQDLSTSFCHYISKGGVIKPLEPVEIASLAEGSEGMEILFGEFTSERFALSFFGEVLGLNGEEEFFEDLCRELCEELYVGVIHQKESDVYYLLTADQRFVPKEEVLAFLESVRFSEGAFDPAACEKFSQKEQENRENGTIGMAAERYTKMQEQSKYVYNPEICNYYVPLSEAEQFPLFDNSFLTLQTENPEQFLLVTGAGFEAGQIIITQNSKDEVGRKTEDSDWNERTEESVWFTTEELTALEKRGILISAEENVRERKFVSRNEGKQTVTFEMDEWSAEVYSSQELRGAVDYATDLADKLVMEVNTISDGISLEWTKDDSASSSEMPVISVPAGKSDCGEFLKNFIEQEAVEKGYADSVEVQRYENVCGSSGYAISYLIGANYRMKCYYRIEDGVLKPFLSVYNSIYEVDYDGDGETEVISTYGTCPETRIYDWRDGVLYSCNVNDALETVVLEQTGAEVMAAVDYNEAENRFEYSFGLEGTPVQGKLTIPGDEK